MLKAKVIIQFSLLVVFKSIFKIDPMISITIKTPTKEIKL